MERKSSSYFDKFHLQLDATSAFCRFCLTCYSLQFKPAKSLLTRSAVKWVKYRGYMALCALCPIMVNSEGEADGS